MNQILSIPRLLHAAVLGSLLLLGSCTALQSSDPTQRSTPAIESVLESRHPKIRAVADNLPRHELQVRVTEVLRSDDGVSFLEHDFDVDASRYFYPASSVKFPIALLALEKLNEDPRIGRNTPFTVSGEETEERTTITQEIIELFVVSDNLAYNRLFEYLGKDDINRRLREKGIFARISHRLSTPNSDRLDYATLRFYPNGSPLEITAPSSKPIEVLPLSGLRKGVAYQENGALVQQPFDFSEKNYFPIAAQHDVMKRLVFPELFRPSERFGLSEADRQFVLKAMSTLPFEAGYSRDDYRDGAMKFFLFGDYLGPLPEHVEIYNKVGFAYGTLTDNAYIRDRRKGKEYLITATLLVNENQTFNDDNYEYYELGRPFFAEFGRQITGLAEEETP